MKNPFRTEPALLIGSLVSILTAIQQWLETNQEVNWRALLPVVVAALIRQFVYSPASYDKALNK